MTKKLDHAALHDVIARRNADTIEALVRQLRTPQGVVPFIGAGMSSAVRLEGSDGRFPQWRDLIAGLAAGLAIEAKVKSLLKVGDFESAASLVERDRPNALSGSITSAFDRTVLAQDLVTGALSCLPYLTSGPVITTNYDRVLEQVFEAAKKPFGASIHGPLQDHIVAAMHTSSHTLVKMHGDCRDREDRVFTRESYEKAYGAANGDGSSTGRLQGLAWLMFTNRPLLFLGCSLEQDRTVDVLREIAGRLPGIRHYAILAAEKSAKAWETRGKKLDQLGVSPLWYFPGEYHEIELLLRKVLTESSTTALPAALKTGSAAARPSSSAKTLDEVAAALPAVSPNAKPFDHSPELGAIAKEARAGKLTFFLGAYAGLDQSFLGSEFYDRLAAKFECPKALAGDRTAVAGYVIAKYGPSRLWQSILEEFQERGARPSAIHHLIAALPSLWRSKNTDASLCVLTTNYDTLMEDALVEAGEPFRLLYYVDRGVDGRSGFVERSPRGVLRRIDRPDNLRRFGPQAHLIVKLNGGLAHFGDLDQQAAVERGAFERLAAQLPQLLPAYLRSELEDRSMLFLGHGLAEPDVRRLIQLYAHRHPIGSWAVQIQPNRHDVQIFAKQGLEVINEDLTVFTRGLMARLVS